MGPVKALEGGVLGHLVVSDRTLRKAAKENEACNKEFDSNAGSNKKPPC